MLLSADSDVIRECMADLSDLGAQLPSTQGGLLARAVKRLGMALTAPTPEEALDYATAALEARKKQSDGTATEPRVE